MQRFFTLLILKDKSKFANSLLLFKFVYFFRPLRVDAKLRQWLRDLDLDESSIRRFSEEDLTFHDCVTFMTREDLRSLKLKLGPELRIWDAIMKQRGNITSSSKNNEA